MLLGGRLPYREWSSDQGGRVLGGKEKNVVLYSAMYIIHDRENYDYLGNHNVWSDL